MLTPHWKDPNRKAALRALKENPADFGFTGERLLPAKLTAEQARNLNAAKGAPLSGKEKYELTRLRAERKEAVKGMDGLNKRLEKISLVRDDAVTDRDAAQRLGSIAISIAQMLAGGEGFGKDGKPDVARINALTSLSPPVTAEERDAVWEEISPKAQA